MSSNSSVCPPRYSALISADIHISSVMLAENISVAPWDHSGHHDEFTNRLDCKLFCCFVKGVYCLSRLLDMITNCTNKGFVPPKFPLCFHKLAGVTATRIPKLLVCVEEPVSSIGWSRVPCDCPWFARLQHILQATWFDKLCTPTSSVRYCLHYWPFWSWQESNSGQLISSQLVDPFNFLSKYLVFFADFRAFRVFPLRPSCFSPMICFSLEQLHQCSVCGPAN